MYRCIYVSLYLLTYVYILTNCYIYYYRVNEGVKIALTEEEAKEEAKKGGTTGEYMDVDTVCNQILRYGIVYILNCILNG